MGIGSSQATVVRTLEPQVVDLAQSSSTAALTTDSDRALLAAWMKVDVHDTIVTTGSQLGWQAGQLFLDVMAQPGVPLPDPPLPLQQQQ